MPDDPENNDIEPQVNAGPSEDDVVSSKPVPPAPTPTPSPQMATPPAPEVNEKPPLESFIPQAKKQGKLSTNMVHIILGVIAAVVIVGIGYYVFTHLPAPSTTTSISTTTVNAHLQSVNSCERITSPGTYSITQNIDSNIQSGACINVTSDNVVLLGLGHSVTGSGPFVGLPPFTYAIELYGVSNVTMEGITFSKFSYGIYSLNSKNIKIINDNLPNATMSGVYLLSSTNVTVFNTTEQNAASKQGGFSIISGGGDLLSNDTIQNNAYFGVILNSTNNKFVNDSINSNPTDLYCNSTAGLRDQNSFSHSSCGVSEYCSFAQCSVQNTPSDLSGVILQNSVSSCGTISNPGVYTLSKSINTSDYLNTSNPLSDSEACITIGVPDVKFSCNGNKISNSGVAIGIYGVFNATVSGCDLVNNTYGIYSSSSFNLNISNSKATRNVFGIDLYNVTTASLFNNTLSNNTYGLYSDSIGILTSGTNAYNNTYGVYINSGGSDAFTSGLFLKNTKADLFCSSQTYNSTTNLFQNIACGVTDCNWGSSCSAHTLPPINVYPLTSCQAITNSGNYSITSNIFTTGSCFSITAKNVTLNCDNHTITGDNLGNAFTISKSNNVSISGSCSITRFPFGINVTNSKYITLNSIYFSGGVTGIVLLNTTDSKVTNSTSFNAGSSGFTFVRTNSSIISYNKALQGLKNSTGFDFLNSNLNIVSFNNATLNSGDGLSFTTSRLNTIFNNSAYNNKDLDYYCSPDSSGIYAEEDGVNFGNTKNNCIWLVELTPLTIAPTCFSINSASVINLHSDMLYPYGNTCFNVYNSANTFANSSIINCEGHTILATNGGTFVNIANATGVVVENCNIKDFSTAVSGTARSVNAFNNTIVGTNVSIILKSTSYPTIQDNRILNASYGIFMQGVKYATVQNNRFDDVNIGVEASGGLGSTYYENYANFGGLGIYLVNATLNVVADNILLNMSKNGIACTLDSINASVSQNKDAGGNVCSSNSQCLWMADSPECKA